MIEIRPLRDIQAEALNQLTGPYTCSETYRVRWEDGKSSTVFTLERIPLAQPFVGRYDHIDDAWAATYLRPSDYVFGAYDGEELVGALIAETRVWNKTLWVHEFHVAAERRRQGIGRMLMEHAAAQAEADRAARDRLRDAEPERQCDPGLPRARFPPGGINISYYTNADYPDRGIAVFMKRRL